MTGKHDHTAAARVGRYEDRMRRDGYVKKHVWVPGDRVAEFENMVTRLRAEKSGIATTDVKLIVARLRRYEHELRGMGIERLSLFGSVVRGDDTPDSDLDVLVEYAPGRKVSLIDVSRMHRKVESITGRHVDIVREKSLKPYVRSSVEPDRVGVF